MNTIKNILKNLVSLVLVIGLLMFVTSYFGVSETRYQCENQVTGQVPSTKNMLFLKFKLYSPLMFWTNSGGIAWSEIPKEVSEIYFKVQKNGEYIQFSNDLSNSSGSLSTLSNFVNLQTNNGHFFEGICKRVQL